MKPITIMLALAGALSVPALGDQPTGLTGTVVDAATGRPVAHATLYYYRAPYLEQGPNHMFTLQTNARGFFSDITLVPGRYILMARLPGTVEGCAVDDLMGGEVAHLRIEIGHSSIMCSGPRVHPALVDPNATADVYRI
jgi:protocatechuate 3,4-dioxygenase beta subunit